VHVLDRLATRGFRLIGWSRPGYLRTPLDAGRTPAEQADAAAALLDELGLPTVVAYGISGGGPTVIEFARRHPRRTTGLVLESAISGHYTPAISRLARRTYLSSYGTWLLTTLASRWPRAAVADFVRQESTLDSLQQWARLDDSLTSGVTCPTLILHGSCDGDADPSHARHAASTIPNATLHLVRDGWHLLPLSTNGDTADRALRAFLTAARR
jgi:pimeloyl-ACP methyl ester carboxylesterase